jgi:hypothetical protein
MKSSAIFSLLIVVVISTISCNRNGTMYYATKWIWNKKLKHPVTMKLELPSDAVVSAVGPGPFKYVNDESESGWASLASQKLYQEFSQHEMITVVPTDPDYVLSVTYLEVYESTSKVYGGDEEFTLSDCRVEIQYELTDGSGRLVKRNDVKAEENESLKEKEHDDGSFSYRVKNYSIDFKSLLGRASDKILAFSTNAIAKDK